MGNLRSEIELIIKQNSTDAFEAAVEITKFLELNIGLYGNGWLDDDELMLKKLDLT